MEPLVRQKQAGLPADLKAWLDPNFALPEGVVLVPFGVRAPVGIGQCIALVLGALFLTVFSSLPLWVVSLDDGLRGAEFFVIGLGLVTGGFQIWIVVGLVLTALDRRKVAAGRWRAGCFLCDDGVLVYWESRATWIPVHALTRLGYVAGPSGMMDYDSGFQDNTSDTWLRWTWLQDEQEHQLLFARNAGAERFKVIEAWAKRRRLLRR